MIDMMKNSSERWVDRWTKIMEYMGDDAMDFIPHSWYLQSGLANLSNPKQVNSFAIQRQTK